MTTLGAHSGWFGCGGPAGRLVLAAALVTLAVSWSGPSRAQPAPGSNPAPVPTATASASPSDQEAAFRRGLDLYEAGQHRAAAAVWEQLLNERGAEKGWKLNYNLGLAYHEAGDATLAVERFEAFLRRVAAETVALPASLEQRREDAAARVQTIKSTHGALVFAAAETAEATVRLGVGEPRPVGFTAYVTPGSHSVEVFWPGLGRGKFIQVTARAGESVAVDTRPPAAPVAPPPEPTTAPPPPLPPPRPEPEAAAFPTTWVLVGAGLTAASFALPIALYTLADDQRTEAELLGQGHTGYAAARDDYDSLRTGYYASYALPGAFGLATAIVAIVGAAQVGEAEPDEAAAVAARLRSAPAGGMVTLEGRF